MTSGKKQYSLDELHLGRPASNLLDETELIFAQVPVLYMNDMSPPCRSVMMVGAALGIPFKMVTVNLMEGEHMTPEYLKKNPQHTIPLLEETGFTVWDSHAISAYLVTSYGRTDDLYPREPRKRAIVDQRLHFDSSILFPSLVNIVFPLLNKQSSSIADSAIEKVNKGLDVLDKMLEETPWLAGASETIADLCCVATVSSLHEMLPILPETYPNVYTWMEICKTLPYYEESNGIGVTKFGEILRGILQ